jgi:hypothetical protein
MTCLLEHLHTHTHTHTHTHRSYDPKSKQWTFPLSAVDEVLAILKTLPGVCVCVCVYVPYVFMHVSLDGSVNELTHTHTHTGVTITKPLPTFLTKGLQDPTILSLLQRVRGRYVSACVCVCVSVCVYDQLSI